MKKIFIFCLIISSLTNNLTFAKETFSDKQQWYESSISSISTGKGVIVAVIDTGVWQAHADLLWSEWLNKKEIPNNNIDDDRNGFVDDYYGWNFIDNNANVTPKGWHGTKVAGIIAAQINGIGIAGIAPGAKIMSLVACNELGGCPTSSVVSAIRYAVDNWAGVINLSLGGEWYVGYTSEYNDIIKYAYSRDVVIVASAGNGDPQTLGVMGQDLDFLKVSPVGNDVDGINMVLGVGASDAPWSNYGKDVDVFAPGTNITTTADPKYTDGFWYDSTTTWTSFSAPYVSWAVALLKSKYPQLKAYDIIDIISSSYAKKLNLLSNMFASVESTWNRCYTNKISANVRNGEILKIEFYHLKSNAKFKLVKMEGEWFSIEKRIDTGSAINILDANTLSINTSFANIPSGNYLLKADDDVCSRVNIGIMIEWERNVTSPPRNQPSYVTTNNQSLDTDISDADVLANNWIINKQISQSSYNLKNNVLRQEVIWMAMKLG
jgi:subtilisin family serine protease